MDRCYFLSGILIGDNGEEVSVRYQEVELDDFGNVRRGGEKVTLTKDRVNDFLLSHEVYGGGDLCLARVNARTGRVIKHGHPKLIQIFRARDKATKRKFIICYLDENGAYCLRILALDDLLDELGRLERLGATVVDEFPKSVSLKPYLLFMRGILFNEEYIRERGN